VLLLQDSGGSGSFSYIAAGLKTKQGYRGTNAILIGDRIASRKTTLSDVTVVGSDLLSYSPLDLMFFPLFSEDALSIDFDWKY